MVALCFGLLAFGVRMCWPEGRLILASMLLPGDATFTQEAFGALVENLRIGVGMAESLTIFCQELLYEIT